MRAALQPEEYDEQWRRLGDFARFNPGARHRRRAILKLMERLDAVSVLDVGCGPGELILALSERHPGLRLTGVDLSAEVIDANRRTLSFAEFDFLDLEKGYLNQTFDLVICSEVIEHLNDWRVGVGHLAAMVRPGGHLIVTCPTGVIHKTEEAWGHVEHPKPEELASVARENGLDPLTLTNWGFPSYRLLKTLTNIDPERAIDMFGSGSYKKWQRVASRLAYWASSLSLPDSRWGCQVFGLFQRV